jgi:hypothetical protein
MIQLELVIGALLLIGSIGGLWFSIPSHGQQIRPFAAHGRDIWIAIAVTSGVGMGIGFLIAGVTSMLEP